ncbi:MAG: UDP-3-O-acyl-N-acetylglucosamine deacetylase, partial [Desulfobulbaceae bacterium]|nr:UDP-3-O-acyl-N-acetylglucosamine deacetylase [Desulfobulbaceae bacterium]
QYTLKRSVSCCGVGLHTGRTVNLTIKPAPANAGICFFRSDLEDKPAVPASKDCVVDTTLATTIGEGAARISTTEHLMAALRGSGIDNAKIDLDSHEVPIMDGSAGPFVHLLKRGGRKRQRALRRVLRITSPISFTDGEKSIRIEPYDGFKVTGRIDFDDELISEQVYSVEVTKERFCREIACARTFGFVEQVEHLWDNGLALGGTLNNVIAIHWDRRSILNEEGLRFDDEFIRHKVLDLIGDMALLGSPVLGHVVADRSGHSLHLGLMQAIADHPECWEYVKFHKRGGSVLRQVVKEAKSAGDRITPFFIPSAQVPAAQSVCTA